MRSSHSCGAVSLSFDDGNLVSAGGLVPVMRLAERIGLADLADDLLVLGGSEGANAGAKVASIVAGMASGADTIDGLGFLRHGGMPLLFNGIRAPSTLGTFLRHFGIGHVGQAQKLLRESLGRMCAAAPLLPGVGQFAIVDVDAKTTVVHGHRKAGAKYGYTGQRGYSFLAGCLSTPGAAPVITGTRLRGGNASGARRADSFVAATIATARTQCGATGNLLVRMDSEFYNARVIRRVTDAGAWFSVTVPQRRIVRNTIAAIAESDWKPVPGAVRDPDTGHLVTTSEIAETTFTAFTGSRVDRRGSTTTGRLIVRRRPLTTTNDQDELFTVWHYHAFLTNSPADIITADRTHRDRGAGIEHVFADLNNSALAHFPSGHFDANAAWLTFAAITHNLLRTIGVLASDYHARARTLTIRHHLVHVPARIARSARTLTLHTPRHWPWETALTRLFTTTHGPPTPA